MALFHRFQFLLLLAVMFLATSGIASDPAVLDDLYKKDAVMDVRGVDKLPEMAKFLFARAETVTVTETVCESQASGTVVVPVTGTASTRVLGTVTQSAPSAPETTKTAGTTGGEAPTTLVSVTLTSPTAMLTTGPTAKPTVTSETRSETTTGTVSVSTSVTLAANTTVAPTHSSAKSTTGGTVTGPSGTHTTSATAHPNSAPIKGASVFALAVGLAVFAAL